MTLYKISLLTIVLRQAPSRFFIFYSFYPENASFFSFSVDKPLLSILFKNILCTMMFIKLRLVWQKAVGAAKSFKWGGPAYLKPFFTWVSALSISPPTPALLKSQFLFLIFSYSNFVCSAFHMVPVLLLLGV